VVPSATIAVVGGSLGGLTAALLLRDLGHDVTIYERSGHKLEQRGAGLGFLPDASRYLVERCGVDIDEISTRTDTIRYLNRDGSIEHERAVTYHYTSWFTVYGRLLEEFDSDRYLTGKEAVTLHLDEERGSVDFTDGTTINADLVVCADGVNSVFRRALLPDVRREYSGYVAWRGMVPESELSSATQQALSDAITYAFYANSHILVYPIPSPSGSVTPGERLINTVWYRNYAAGGDFDDLMTDATGRRHDPTLPPGAAREEHVAEMRSHALARLPSVVSEAVVAAKEPFVQAVYDLDVDRMAFGRACLIGDAAFVMRPHAAAGTAKAAANAWGLAEAMEEAASIPDALNAWEPEQLRIGRELVRRTQRLGFASQIDGSWNSPTDDSLFRLRDEGP
jgi:2,6-dihydroxypyridine 3-monooxygenase